MADEFTTQTVTLGLSTTSPLSVTFAPNGGALTLTPMEDIVQWTLASSGASIVGVNIGVGTGAGGATFPWPNGQPVVSIAGSLWTVSDGDGVDGQTVTYGYSAGVATTVNGTATVIWSDPEIVNNPPGSSGPVDPGVVTTPPGTRK